MKEDIVIGVLIFVVFAAVFSWVVVHEFRVDRTSRVTCFKLGDPTHQWITTKRGVHRSISGFGFEDSATGSKLIVPRQNCIVERLAESE